MDLKDQVGNVLSIAQIPKRVICLVPSLSETLVDLGLLNKLVGVTKFCIHPPTLRKMVNVIGGTKNPRIEGILKLQPDLIITNKEENRKEDIHALGKYCSVYVSDIRSIDDTIKFLTDMCKIFVIQDGAYLDKIRALNQSTEYHKIRTCYLIWRDPFMTIGHDTFIHHMMDKYGFENVFADHQRYPVVTLETIQNVQPEIIMLSSEPYPFKKLHIDQLQSNFNNTKIMLVDGALFSWYGTRILLADKYLKQLRNTII